MNYIGYISAKELKDTQIIQKDPLTIIQKYHIKEKLNDIYAIEKIKGALDVEDYYAVHIGPAYQQTLYLTKDKDLANKKALDEGNDVLKVFIKHI